MHGGGRLPARHSRGRARWPTALAVAVVLMIIGGGSYVLLAPSRPHAALITGPAWGLPPSGAVPVVSECQPATVSITWVGDMTFGMLNAWPPGGTGSLLDDVRPYLHSSLTVGNLESVLGDEPVTKCSPGESDCYEFEAPPSTAADLRHDGFAAVNVANNHTMDAGVAGESEHERRAARQRPGLDRPAGPDHVPDPEGHQDGAAGVRAVAVRRQRAGHPGGAGPGPDRETARPARHRAGAPGR